MFAVMPCVHADDLSEYTLDELYAEAGVSGEDSFVVPVSMLEDVIESNTDDLEELDDGDDIVVEDDDLEVHVLKPYINDILEMADDTLILIYVSGDKIKVFDRPLPPTYTL